MQINFKEKICSLKVKIFSPLILIIITIILYGLYFWVPQSINYSKEQITGNVENTLKSVGEGLIPLILENQLSNIYDNLENIKSHNQNWVDVFLFNKDGMPVYPFEEKAIPQPSSTVHVLTQSIMLDDIILGKIILVYDFAPIATRIEKEAMNLFMLVSGGLITFAMFLYFYLQHYVIRPSGLLADAAFKMANGIYDVQLPNPKEDEIGRLIRRFEAMRFLIQNAQQNLKKERDRANQASESKTQFLANMSHELRTPMNGIVGLSGLLVESKLNTEQKEFASAVHKSGQNLLTLLNDLLDFSKIEAGELTLENIPFKLRSLIDETVDLLSTLAARKGNTINVNTSPVMPKNVVGDYSRLQQILNNLIGNAIKFTENGQINIDISAKKEGEKTTVHFRVEDTGIGISEDKLDLIFNKFTQADTSTARKFGGTGLGLAITKNLVEMMDGTIGVESIEGQGSTFWFKIPFEVIEKIETDEEEQNTYTPKSDVFYPGSKVLLVDDHPINLLFAKKLLIKLGIEQITEAYNGKQAIDALQDADFHFVLMDCQMPEMDGLEATQIIRENEKQTGGHVPIIALTADAMRGAQEKCLKIGMDDYISKPIDPSRLSQIIAKHLPEEMGSGITETKDEEGLANESDALQNQDNSESPVDLEHLRMFTDGDQEEEKIIFDIFFSQAEESITKLESTLGSGESNEWRAAAHKLKGASANLGAAKLSEFCKEAESNCEGNADEKNIMLSSIKTELSRVESFLSSLQ